ncbi:hypothetical protein WG66_008047 [Moniliophthora roreri]|nr:hypothetical protein WG66_008047 [Moniliophthora roreri]
MTLTELTWKRGNKFFRRWPLKGVCETLVCCGNGELEKNNYEGHKLRSSQLAPLLISEGTGIPEDEVKETVVDSTNTLAFIDQLSILVLGMYEGGLKTCGYSLDVVDYLSGLNENEGLTIDGELQEKPTEDNLWDYNASALDLVTFPNVIIILGASFDLYFAIRLLILAIDSSSPLAAFRNTLVLNEDETDKGASTFPPPDPSEPAEFPITLKAAFESSLHEDQRKSACKGFDPDEQLGTSSPSPYLCIVTAKIIYFGARNSFGLFGNGV